MAVTDLLATFMMVVLNALPLAILVLAVRKLKRTQDPGVPLSLRDQRWRQAALALMWLLVAGFGLCGGFGTFAGLSSFAGSSSSESRAYGQLFLAFGLCGLLIALACAWVIRKYRRRKN
jgi:TRAP-type C4-dicarboxylate transport system permease large subunit